MSNKKKADIPLWVEANLDEITPLDLAKLAIGLKQAGFITESDDRIFLGKTLKFLDVSTDVLNIRREAEAFKKQEDEFDNEVCSLTGQVRCPTPSPYATPPPTGPDYLIPMFLQSTGKEFVSVVEIMKKLGTVNLTAEELATLKLKGEWRNFTPEKKLECAFLFLTRGAVIEKVRQPVPTAGRWAKGERVLKIEENKDEMIRDGVPAFYVPILWRFLKTAHEQRKHRQQVAAPKKRKPRAPRGVTGQFQKKARSPEGEYKRHKELDRL